MNVKHPVRQVSYLPHGVSVGMPVAKLQRLRIILANASWSRFGLVAGLAINAQECDVIEQIMNQSSHLQFYGGVIENSASEDACDQTEAQGRARYGLQTCVRHELV